MIKYSKILVLAPIAILVGCGESSNNSKNDKIDLRLYYPKVSMTKIWQPIRSDKDSSDFTYSETFEVKENTITAQDQDGIKEYKRIFTDTNITTIVFFLGDNNTETQTTNRYMNIGDTIRYLKGESISLTCKIESKENKFQKYDKTYEGDLLKIKCIMEGNVTHGSEDDEENKQKKSYPYYDVSYLYLQKDIGEIAEINENCIPDENLDDIVNDKKSGKECAKKFFDYEFYLP